MTSKLIDFYRGTGTDGAGRMLGQVRKMSLKELELTHDYIQWLFPLCEISQYNAEAPIVDDEVIIAFKDPVLRKELLSSLQAMLRFYGLRLFYNNVGNPVIRPGDAMFFMVRTLVWLGPNNHNYMRLTRIMTSLNLLGCTEEAKALQKFLLTLYDNTARVANDVIGNVTKRFWKAAC